MNISGYGPLFRVGGLASGLDTDDMVKKLMQAENVKLDKLWQKKQETEWKRDDYREITNLLRGFESEFLDKSSSTNMLSEATFSKYIGKSSDESVVTATGGAGVISSSHTINVTQLATAANATSTDTICSGDKLSYLDTLETVSSKLGGESLEFDAEGKFQLTINGTNIEVNKTDTLGTLIDKVNDSDAGVKMSYSSFLDKFTIEAKETGAGTISLNDNGSKFFTSTKLTAVTAGQDAEFNLDGVSATRKNNTFTIDGVMYNLHKTGNADINLEQDTDAVFNDIKNFVNMYNGVLDKINGKLSEKYYRNFGPLTDNQKKELSDKEIEIWEGKAKSGLLKHDSILEGITSRMRGALYNKIEGISGGLYDIGITTDTWKQRGKLVIDEDKLKAAIKNNPDKVAKLFCKESTSHPGIVGTRRLSNDEKEVRYNEEGFAYRLYDILEDSVSTFRDSDGKKGILLEKAGLIGETSELKNLMYDKISDYEKEIDDMKIELAEKENRYYLQFARLERAMSDMSAQSNWFMGQMGG